MNVFDIGPMTGRGTIAVDLGYIPDRDGNKFVALLQFRGEMPVYGSSASLVNGRWVKNPPPPARKDPVVTLMPIGGGPRSTFEASAFVENARCGLGFILAGLWGDERCVHFERADIRHLAEQIETSIPEREGEFKTIWVAVPDDGCPF
jgi:hypothetical protein